MNTILDQLKKLLPCFSPTTTLKVGTNETLSKLLHELQKNDDVEWDENVTNELYSILDKKRITKEIKKAISENTEKIIKSIEERLAQKDQNEHIKPIGEITDLVIRNNDNTIQI